ncbi:MAG: hypothetical protein SF029_11745 [bacterium]|nr:hypothetical protein [bacterium]
MNRGNDQGLLIVGLLVFLLICAIIAVVLQGQQVAETNTDLNDVQLIVTDLSEQVVVAVNARTTAEANVTQQRATSAAEATAQAEAFALSQTEAANQIALQQTALQATVVDAINLAATREAEATAQVQAIQVEATAQVQALQAEATAEIAAVQTAAAATAEVQQTAAFAAGLEIANATSQPAFEAFSTQAAGTQIAQQNVVNTAQAEVATRDQLALTLQAQEAVVATYNAIGQEVVGTRQAQATAAATVKAPTPTPVPEGDGDTSQPPIEVGDLLAETDFAGPDRRGMSLEGLGRNDIIDEQWVILVTERDSRFDTANFYEAFANSLYAEVEVDLSECPADGFFGFTLANPDNQAQLLFAGAACDLNLWRIGWFDATNYPLNETEYFAIDVIRGVPPSDGPVRLGVRWEGETVTLYLNGVELGSATDSRLSAATLGLFVESTATVDVVVRFDNLRVWALP